LLHPRELSWMSFISTKGITLIICQLWIGRKCMRFYLFTVATTDGQNGENVSWSGQERFKIKITWLSIPAKHKNILVKILKDIYTDSTISTVLGFKGGTAATLFYGLDRFSVDLDFDLLDSGKEDYAFERVKEIMERHGKLKQARKKRFNLFIFFLTTRKISMLKMLRWKSIAANSAQNTMWGHSLVYPCR